MPRTTVTATDEAVTLISVARKRWDTTNPLAWSNNIKNKTKQNKINNRSGGNVTAADSYARAVAAAASA